jgi:hypothetical protein
MYVLFIVRCWVNAASGNNGFFTMTHAKCPMCRHVAPWKELVALTTVSVHTRRHWPLATWRDQYARWFR